MAAIVQTVASVADSVSKTDVPSVVEGASQTAVVEPLLISSAKRKFILLVDVSGSVSGSFYSYSGGLKVFEKMTEVAGTLGLDEGWVVFWSSPRYNQGRMQNGVMALPFAVKGSTLSTAFAAGASVIGGGTCPPLGFRAINPEWLKHNPMVYLFTDGQIGCQEWSDNDNKKALADEIRKLTTDLTIVAVEAMDRDFSNVESVNSAAGGDIYKIIQEQRLTSKVSKFVSVCRNGTFTQIDRVKAPAGYAPYGSQYFSVLRVHEFMRHVATELKSNSDEGFQMQVAQKLSATLEVLTRDRPQKVADDIVKMFSRLFTIDNQQVEWIMTGGIASERGGQAQVLAHYRSQLKDLFKQADGLIKQDVKRAVGLSDTAVSYLIGDRVLSCSGRLVDKTLSIHGVNYPRAGYAAGVPVFPLLSSEGKLNDLQDQCLRQWTRAIYAAFYRVHPTSDEIIFLVLGTMMKVCNSTHVPDDVKNAYRQLAMCMLRKKRLNSVQTEFDRINSGEFPMPNSGKINDFFDIMNAVAQKLEITATPLKLWHSICKALSDVLAARQEQHCTAELASEIKFNEVQYDAVPDGQAYDYSCIVTLEDVSVVGGYAIKPHHGIAGLCAPVYLLSDAGKHTMLASNNCVCPVCYAPLSVDSFAAVGPKIAFDLPAGYDVFRSRFTEPQVGGYSSSGGQSGSGGRRGGGRGSGSQSDQKSSGVGSAPVPGGIRNANGKPGKLVIMKGVVGAGKSHTSALIKQTVEARGGVCLVEGTDKYAKTGIPMASAVNMVQNALKTIPTINNDDLVVVIDTCGENSHARNMTAFNVDFTGWTRTDLFPNLDRGNFTGYFAWSLRNVLRRVQPGPNDSHWLNPVGASVQVCIDVHKKKAKALFGGEMRNWQFAGATVANLDALASAYEAKLKPFVCPV